MITLKKAKLIDQIEVYCEFDERILIYDKPKTAHKTFSLFQEPHDDLINSLQELSIHLAVLCEIIPAQEVNFKEKEYLENSSYKALKVTGVSFGGSDEHSGVTIVGRRTLKNNRVLNLIAPFTKYEDEHNQYKFSTELYDSCSKVEQEFIAYMQGKYAPSKQLELTL